MFEIEVTNEFRDWYYGLSDEQRDAVTERVDLLEQRGPALRRPVVGAIKGSKHDPQMKELRIESTGSLRILFTFDPRRTAILLLGGDKTDNWTRWYRTAIPQADALYDTYLAELRDEGQI